MDKKLSYLYNIAEENKNMGLLKLKTNPTERNFVAVLQCYKISFRKEMKKMHLSKLFMKMSIKLSINYLQNCL